MRAVAQADLQACVTEMQALLARARALLRVTGSGAHADMARVAAHFGVPVAILRGPVRSARISWARTCAVRALRDRGLSSPEIGQILHRDHTTVLHALRVFRDTIAQDPRRRRDAAALDLIPVPQT